MTASTPAWLSQVEKIEMPNKSSADISIGEALGALADRLDPDESDLYGDRG